MKKFLITILIFAMFATSIAPLAYATTNKAPNYRSYAGKWISTAYEKKRYQGDLVEIGDFFTLKFISATKAKFSIMSVSSPPALRIANYDGTVTFIKGKASFIVKDDGWFNQGRGTITLAGKNIKINYKTTKRDEMANWELGATGTYRRSKYLSF